MSILPIGLVPSAHEFQTHGVSGKLSAPVAKGYEVYAHFRHITGVTAGDGLVGIPLFKLRILDNLIESYLQADKPVGLASDEVQVPLDPTTVDTTISALAADLRERILSTPDAAGARVQATGILLNLGA